MSKKKVLGLIPARGGSKGIPDKNIIPIGGKPLIGWVVEEALKSSLLDEVIISSDSKKIIDMVEKLGIRAPFLRPAELAQDDTLVIEVIIHTLKWLQKNENKQFEYICLLQPTSPLGKVEDYDKAVSLAIEKNADTVISVYECSQQHPAIMYTLNGQGRAKWFVQELGWEPMARRQDLPKIYMRSGIVYIFRTAHLFEKGTLYGERLYTIEVPIERGMVDINGPEDLILAEAMMINLNKKGSQSNSELCVQ